MSEIIHHDARVVWDIRREFPELYKDLELSAHGKWLHGWLTSTEQRVPASRSCAPFAWENWSRPPGHARALYQTVEPFKLTMSIKGTEALCRDVFRELEQASKRDMFFSRYVSQLEWWLRMEQKAPFVFTVKEGLTEARIAAEIQTDYQRRYGRFAKLPLPLKVFAFPDTLRDEYFRALMSLSTPSIEGLAAFVLSSGLGAYTYVYEGALHRINPPWQPASAGPAGHAGRRAAAAVKHGFDRFNIRQSLIRWVQLCVELLAIGWMPTTYNGDITGQMVRYNNAFLDGGFADLDSARRLSDISSDQDFVQSFWVMISELIGCYAIVMSGQFKFSTGFFSTAYPIPSFGEAMYAAVVWDVFRDCMAREAANGTRFDDRIARLMSREEPALKLDHMLEAIYPATIGAIPTSAASSGARRLQQGVPVAP